jgi:hypothetical protein
MSLLNKDVDVNKSFIYGGFLILKYLKKIKATKKATFYAVSQELTKHGIIHYRQQFFCLMFLYSAGLITFNEPYIEASYVN